MRYKPEYKAEARARLLEAAGSLAKEKGIASTGVDEFMKAAGMTSGAFYSHFGSKAAFLTALVENELLRPQKQFTGKNPAALRKLLKQYLSLAHVEHPSQGCPLPALSAEIARTDPSTRQQFEDQLNALVDEAGTAFGDPSIAWAVLAQITGAVMLARAMNSETARLQVLHAAYAQVERLLPLDD